MSEGIERKETTRRSFLARLTGGVIGLGSLFGLWFSARSLVPNVLYERPRKVKVGLPGIFPEGVSFIDEHRVYLFRERNAFYAVSGVCSHLGCTVKYSPFRQAQEMTVRSRKYASKGEFHCPCHGSKFRDEGTNYSGPAPRPLECFHLEVAPEDGQLRVDMGREVDREFRLVV